MHLAQKKELDFAEPNFQTLVCFDLPNCRMKNFGQWLQMFLKIITKKNKLLVSDLHSGEYDCKISGIENNRKLSFVFLFTIKFTLNHCTYYCPMLIKNANDNNRNITNIRTSKQ